MGPHSPGAAHINYPKGSWEALIPLPQYMYEIRNCHLPPKRKPMAFLTTCDPEVDKLTLPFPKKKIRPGGVGNRERYLEGNNSLYGTS